MYQLGLSSSLNQSTLQMVRQLNSKRGKRELTKKELKNKNKNKKKERKKQLSTYLLTMKREYITYLFT
jgi:hypothetical protein